MKGNAVLLLIWFVVALAACGEVPIEGQPQTPEADVGPSVPQEGPGNGVTEHAAAETGTPSDAPDRLNCPTEDDLVVHEIDGAKWVSITPDTCQPFTDDALVHGTLQLDEDGCLSLGDGRLLILPPNAELERGEDGQLRLTRDGAHFADVGSTVEFGGGAWTFNQLPQPCHGSAGDRHILMGHFD
jgi:hypothetical protein